MTPRFIRMPAGTIGGLKLGNRGDFNKTLSWTESDDVERFGALLRRAFGPPDMNPDADYSYTVHDNETGVTVRAYSAQSGPAYGGRPADCFVDFENDDYRLKPEVERTLVDLDRWLEGQELARES